MSKTTKSVPFFTDDITIKPHTASSLIHVGRHVSIKKFSDDVSRKHPGRPIAIRLSEVIDTGELLVECGRAGTDMYYFMEGPSVRLA